MESKQLISKKELNNMAFRSMFLQASFNYERMQACGWAFSLIPGLKKIFKDDPEGLKNSFRRHMEFFNTHPFLVSAIMGLVLAMEEKKEDPELIRGLKVAMMGPLGGIGDAIFWFTLIPITASLGAGLALEGNILGPILFIILFNLVHLPLRFGLIHYFYAFGLKAFDTLKTITVHVQKAASIIGVTVVGALIASFVRLNLALEFNIGEKTVNVQNDIINAIMPNLLPLLLTLGIYYLITKKGKSPTTIIWFIIGISLVLSYFNIL
ncbi:MAG: PTS system mannose/fructose/sorbose family transporter subunit IID [Brevinema sp.]